MAYDDNSQESDKLDLRDLAAAIPTLSEPPLPPSPTDDAKAEADTEPASTWAAATPALVKPESTSTTTDTALEPQESTYHLKWIPWNTERIPIVMQSINGPCPLIATINVLLFREKIKLPQMLEQITSSQLLTYLGESIMDSVPQDIINDEHAILNFEQNIHDAIEIMPKLKTGLDVNVKFSSITDFEYTPECIIFDLLRIPLYHGWLVDPGIEEVKKAIGTMSYNQLVDSIICNEATMNPEALAKKLISEEFLATTASQLTEYGLKELRTQIEDNEIGILFRNNHFLTLIKREGDIYTLVTDHGYLTEDNIVWESLDNIEGAGRFFDANFQLSGSSTSQKTAFDDERERNSQVETDYQIALRLKAEEEEALGAESQNRQVVPFQDNLKAQQQQQQLIPQSSSSGSQLNVNDDFELAKKLQQEECDYWLSSVPPDELQTRLNTSNAQVGEEASEGDVATFQQSEFPPLKIIKRQPIAITTEIERLQSTTIATAATTSSTDIGQQSARRNSFSGLDLKTDSPTASQAMNPSYDSNFPNTSQASASIRGQRSNPVARNSQQYGQLVSQAERPASGTRRSKSERNIKSSKCSLM